MDLSKLFDLSYLFDSYPGSSFKFMVLFIGIFLIMIIGSFYLESWIRKNPLRESLKITFPSIGGKLRLLGLGGFIFLWIRYENLPYLSMRALFLAYLLFITWFIGKNIHRFKKKLPEAIEKQHVSKKHKDYLPKKKKKSKKKRR